MLCTNTKCRIVGLLTPEWPIIFDGLTVCAVNSYLKFGDTIAMVNGVRVSTPNTSR
jgi:hypothetical protein